MISPERWWQQVANDLTPNYGSLYQFDGYIEPDTAEFLKCFLQRFHSYHTKRSYADSINEFSAFIKKDPCAAKAEDCEAYLKHLFYLRDEQVLRTNTILRKKRQVSSMYTAMNEPIYREMLHLPDGIHNHFLDLRTPDVAAAVQYNKVPSLAELDILYRYLRANDMLTCLAFLFAFKCYMKTEEILRVKFSDFYYDSNDKLVIKVTSGFSNYHFNAIPEDVSSLLHSYFEVTADCDYEFIFTKKNGKRITQGILRDHLRKAIDKCGINSYTFNDFRNAGTVYAVTYGVDVTTVSQALGHKKPHRIQKLESVSIQISDATYDGISFRPVTVSANAKKEVD